MRRSLVFLVFTGFACRDATPPTSPAPHGVTADVTAATATPEGPYEIVDLGTVGGESFATAINNRGQVTGWGVVGYGVHAFLWERGVMQDLGTLGGSVAKATGLNEAGQVVGVSTTADGDTHAFLWMGGAMQELGAARVLGDYAFDGGCNPPFDPFFVGPTVTHRAEPAINSHGDVAWTAPVAGTSATRAFLWSGGVAQDLGTLGGASSSAWAINEAGQVAGLSEVAGEMSPHVVLWDGGTAHDLGAVPPPRFPGDVYDPAPLVVGVNALGQVIVTARRNSSRAVLWDGSQMVSLGAPPGARTSDVVAINDAGQIAGTGISEESYDGVHHPFLWANGAFQLLPEVSTPYARDAVSAMNASGVVAGFRVAPLVGSYANGCHPLVWDGGVRWELGTLGVGQSALGVAINARGDVAGWSWTRRFFGTHAALWRRIIPVAVDVKPGDADNAINRHSNGNTPVALLSSATFDATTADRSTVTFAGAPALDQGGGPEDVNGDGLPDVVFHFATEALNLPDGTTEACLRGLTTDGASFKGCDSVR